MRIITFSLLSAALALGLASCSNDVGNENSNAQNPDANAKRPVTITVGNSGATGADGKPALRSIIDLTTGSKWEVGDKILAYNLTDPQGYDILTAEESGNDTRLSGEVNCKQGDDVALFYPARFNVREQKPGTLQLDMKGQNGTLQGMKRIDYTWGITQNIRLNGAAGVGHVDMKKQYAILRLKFKINDRFLTNVKRVVISNVPDEAEFDLRTSNYKFDSKDGYTVETAQPVAQMDVAVFPDNHFRPTFRVEAADGETFIVTVKQDMVVERAKYYTYTLKMDEEEPWIEIDSIKWSRSNLQYDPTVSIAGWEPGYHLAKNPWDYYYMEKKGELSIGTIALPDNYCNSKFDHFRWGDIVYGHNYGRVAISSYWGTWGNIQTRYNSDKRLGDLAHYASKGKYALPTKAQFESLMRHTGQYFGYYCYEGHRIYGLLFDPTVDECQKGYVLDRNGRRLRRSNQDAGYISRANCYMKCFTKEDISKGVFFPFGGMYTDYNEGWRRLSNPGNWGMYWTADGSNQMQAAAFAGKFMFHCNQFHYGTTKGRSPYNPKYNMYSIRPIYIK